MTKLHVEVRADDIADGIPGDTDQCPIAIAVRRALRFANRWEEPSIESLYLYAVWRHGGEFIRLPTLAYNFIKHFDNGYKVGPLAFDLEVPD